jgi:hypothetical protein
MKLATALKVLTCILKKPSSNFGLDIQTEGFHGFLSTFMQISG